MNIWSAYEWVDAWQRAAAIPSVKFAMAGALLDDRELAPPYGQMLAFYPQLLESRRMAAATFKLMRRLTQTYEKPEFGIESIELDERDLAVREEVVFKGAFCRLLKFSVPERSQSRQVLLVAPMAGHYATLLRETVRDLLPHYTVYVTDWANARDVPLAEGGFDLDDYIDQVVTYIRRLGPDVHAIGVCQAGVPLMAAIALIEAEDTRSHVLPKSVTVMGAPLDVECSPTEVNKLAAKRNTDWFVSNLVSIVPSRFPGAHRAVYPGYLQLTAFLAMNPERHEKSARDAVRHFADGDYQSAAKIDSFYGEFLSVMDLTAEFYIQTVDRVFRENRLARGTFCSRGRMVDLSAIRRTPILAIEAERDDITGLGQTRAILDLTTGLPEDRKAYLFLENAGHYGLFSGSRFRNSVAPMIRKFHEGARERLTVAAR